MSKNLILKRSLGYLMKPFFAGSKQRRVVLIYHAIGDGPWSVSEKEFEQQMLFLATNSQVVSLKQLINNELETGLQVAITFDDGYESVYDLALPIMEKHGITATVYLNTGMIDESRNNDSIPEQGHYQGEKFMTWPQVRKLVEKKWNIGSHGVQHYDLTKMDVADVNHELKQSKQDIEQKLKISCTDFSYTWGHYNTEVKNLVAEAGYSSSVSGEHGPLEEDSSQFAIPRVDIRKDYQLNDFKAVVFGHWDYLNSIQKLRRNGVEHLD